MPSSETCGLSTIPDNCDDLVRLYGPLVSTLCRRMIEDRDRARDAAQEVWIEVLKSLPGFRGEARLSTWIAVVARRTINRWMAGEWQSDFRTFGRDCQKTMTPPVEEFGRNDPEQRDLWTRMICDICLTSILHCLEPGTRFLFLLRAVLKMEYSEIAGIMEMEEAAVRQRFSRSCRKLRNFGKRSCALIDPGGECRCGHREFLAESTLVEEFRKLRKTVNRLETWYNAEIVFPGSQRPPLQALRGKSAWISGSV